MERTALLLGLILAISLLACRKEEGAAPGPTTQTGTSLCIGAWSVDSTYLPSTGEYYAVVPKTYTFSNSGQVTINSLGGGQSQWTFQVVQESTTPAPNEIGRTLIWATDTDSEPDVRVVMLMIHQSASEGFLLITTSLAHASPWNSTASVNEDLQVNGNDVFPSWAKCYRQ